MDLLKLKTELAKPEYASLSDEEVAKALAVADREVDAAVFDAGLFVSALNWTEYDKLTPKQTEHVRLMVTASTMPITPSIKAELASLFPTIDLKPVLKRTGTRAEAAGLDRAPTPSEVADARRII